MTSKPLVNFWLLTASQNQLLRLVMWNKNKPQKKMNLKLELGGAIPTWGPPQGRHTNIHFFQPARSVLKSEAPHINNNSSPLVVLMLFFTIILQLLVEQTNFYYQQHLDEQARPVC